MNIKKNKKKINKIKKVKIKKMKLQKLLSYGIKADCIISDVPYLIGKAGTSHFGGYIKHACENNGKI